MAEKAWGSFRAGFDNYAFHEGLAGLWKLVGELNRFLVRRVVRVIIFTTVFLWVWLFLVSGVASA